MKYEAFTNSGESTNKAVSKKNMGDGDRAIRIIAAGLIIAWREHRLSRPTLRDVARAEGT